MLTMLYFIMQQFISTFMYINNVNTAIGYNLYEVEVAFIIYLQYLFRSG